MLTALRQLRHGRLKRFHPIWRILGRLYHYSVKAVPGLFPASKQNIGPYGPFYWHPTFAFSPFSSWGKKHNDGFEACIESCRGKQCVFDIGAHIGLVSLPMSQQIDDSGRVYAFEPATVNRNYLNYHLKRNRIQNVDVVPVLVGAENKNQVDFYELDDDTGMNSVVPIQKTGNFQAVQKNQVTLDTFCEAHQLKPEVIKIDVEGYEIDVLKGAQNILQRYPIELYLSVHPAHLKKLGYELTDLTNLIDFLGYTVTELDGTPVKEFQLKEYRVQQKASQGGSL